MREKVFIGIDPGKSGALAIIKDQGIFVFDFTDIMARQALKDLVNEKVEVYAVLEKVHAMPKQGVTSSFSFGENFGRWKERLELLSISYELVTPQTWQKSMYDHLPAKPSIPKMPETKLNQEEYNKLANKIKNERKKIGKDFSLYMARRKYPQAMNYLTRKMDHNRAEAILIAGYCKKINDNTGYIDYLA